MAPLAIRVDGSRQMGLGHVMRCLALATELEPLGVSSTMILGGMDRLADRVLATVPMPSIHLTDSEPKPVLSGDDAAATIGAARDIGAQWVLVDHYGAGRDYFGRLHEAGFSIAVIEDGQDRDLRDADWAVNPGPTATGSQARLSPSCHVLNGGVYALLRPEFARIRNHAARRFTPSDNRVLLAFGGSDVNNLFKKALAGLDGVQVTLDVRLLTPRRIVIPQGPHAARQLVGVEDVAAQMAWCDVAVSSAGLTALELASLGVPGLLYPTSDSEDRVARSLAVSGGFRYLQRMDDEGRIIEGLLLDPSKRRKMSEAGMGVIDGQGAGRVARDLAEMIADRR